MSLVNTNWNHNYLYTNGVRLHYVSEGEGNLMLMLHGFPEFWYSWRHQIKAFSKNYCVVAPDLRGYNYSDQLQSIKLYDISELVKDIAGIITNLGYEKCILVAHDWGGLIAWYFADQYPEMVEKLIVLNIPHPAKLIEGFRTPQQLKKSWYVFFFQLPFLPELLIRWNNYEAIESAFMNMAIDKSAFSDEDIQAYKKSAAKPGALTAMINYYRCFVKQIFTSEKSWNKLDVPTLMIWGENDTALGKELTYGTEGYVTDFTIRYIPNCSHWVQQEQPDLVNQYIADFLDISLS
ncbi:alpha/beta fold hydrolase [Crocosphaera chwakensis]|uniref:Alpha/beta hydrolase fold protein n=1 Tax=Crocosphaera chwakensis CCY0110 TaxID=391612 RepID=A3IM44_9CHRO|nr:alpha/beta hydrolase [Crocosphaera chwakensis]EAZ92500.1 Alpha/beta hydrolase fold protein [Crocosphaera chwakensis CCY0110]